MRPSFLLNPDAFTRGEGIGAPILVNGNWPPGAQEAFALGASLAYNEQPPIVAPAAALLTQRLSQDRLDHFLARTGGAPAPVVTRPAFRPGRSQ